MGTPPWRGPGRRADGPQRCNRGSQPDRLGRSRLRRGRRDRPGRSVPRPRLPCKSSLDNGAPGVPARRRFSGARPPDGFRHAATPAANLLTRDEPGHGWRSSESPRRVSPTTLLACFDLFPGRRASGVLSRIGVDPSLAAPDRGQLPCPVGYDPGPRGEFRETPSGWIVAGR